MYVFFTEGRLAFFFSSSALMTRRREKRSWATPTGTCKQWGPIRAPCSSLPLHQGLYHDELKLGGERWLEHEGYVEYESV